VVALASWAVAIVIPARNEEELIAGTINRVLTAVRRSPLSRCWVVVVADSCTDATAEIAEQVLDGHGEVVSCRLAAVGPARRRGTDAALARFAAHPAERIWLANTDADTQVPEHWLQRQLSWANRGFHGVAGTVKIKNMRVDDRDISEELMSDYLIHEDGSHPHIHGANLGVRADAYRDAGGWSGLALAEEHCLWRRLRARQWKLASASDFAVDTSARLEGRAPGGFAATLSKKIGGLHAREMCAATAQ
jgi:cellulose synthase/poly-beta-1,6-N-acetylglucosamine synthase-like glycosyltransferase